MEHNIERQVAMIFVLLTFLFVAEVGAAKPLGSRSIYSYDDFRRWPVNEIYTGTPTLVISGADPQARQFRTRITEGAKQGPNFAGIYTVVEWGCGTNCQQTVVINARTGRVSDWLTTEFGSSYKIDSKLFIKNPDSKECSKLEWCETQYYLFENGKFSLLKNILQTKSPEGI